MSNVSHAADWISECRADNVALAPRISEDWLSLVIGLLIFALALAGLDTDAAIAVVVADNDANDQEGAKLCAALAPQYRWPLRCVIAKARVADVPN